MHPPTLILARSIVIKAILTYHCNTMEKHTGKNNKSPRSFSKADSVLMFIFVTLFSLVIIDILTPTVRFIFEPTGLGQSWYSLISGVLILFIGIFWGVSKIADQIKVIKRYWERWRTIISKASRFIGVTEVSESSLSYILLSMFIGMLFNFLILYGVAVLRGGSIHVIIPSSETYLIIQYLVAGPLFEELVFRGIYLSSFLRIFGSNYLSAALGLIMSSFTFGWIHPEIFLSLVIKTSGGFLLGIIYMLKWRKNFMAAFSAHFGLNLVGIFLYVS
jgi:membrane protease YdiL (CAAX protease family)